MKLFLDTANLDEIRAINKWGVLGGLTSNPTLIAKEREDAETHMKALCAEVDGPVSLEITENGVDAMYEQGKKLAAVAPNAVVKTPMTPDGLEVGKRLVRDGIPVNVTLTFSPAQAILAAEIGATYVSPFLGRLDDAGADGLYVLREICEIYEIQGYDTQVLAASLRHPMHIIEAAKAGADVATMPYSVFTLLVKHPLTDLGLEKFTSDWKKLQEELKEGAR